MNIKRNIRLAPMRVRKKGVLVEENAPIRLRVSYAGKRVDMLTGLSIDLKDWDDSNNRVKANRVNKTGQTSDEINYLLNIYDNDMDRYLFSSFAQEVIPEEEEVKLKFQEIRAEHDSAYSLSINKRENKENELSLYDVFDEFTSQRGKMNNWTEDTYTKFKTVKYHLQNYNSDLKFEDLTEEGLTDLILYFIRDQKMRNGTTKKYYEFISWFLRYAHEKGYNKNETFLTYKPKLKTPQKKIIFLEEHEIHQIRDLKLPKTKMYLDRVRDVLLFLCYSGLRHSDAYNLKEYNVFDDYLDITTVKTTDSLRIELNDVTREILDKYKNVSFRNGKALPVISNQKTNEYLKELAELAGLDEMITETYFIGNKRYDISKPKYEFVTSHIGRRTFICLCIAKEVPIQVIMKWTGHTDYKSMIPYIEVAGKTKKEQMNKLNF